MSEAEGLRQAMKLANEVRDAWRESSDDEPPAWCVTNALITEIARIEGKSIKDVVASLGAA